MSITSVAKIRRKDWRPAIERSQCPKCGGAGWVWGHELHEWPEWDTDNRYPCDNPQCESGYMKIGWSQERGWEDIEDLDLY